MYTMTLEINQRCNLRCQYCYLGEKTEQKCHMKQLARQLTGHFSIQNSQGSDIMD